MRTRIFTIVLLTFFKAAIPACAVGETGIKVVIDPGHSRARQGAISCSGRGESEYNQALSSAISLTLAAAGIGAEITTAGQDMSLAERAAQSQGSGLLLSVHHDSVQPQFITIKSAGSAKQYCSTKAQGFSIFVSGRNRRYDESLRFAEGLGEALIKRGIKPSLHHAEDIPGERRELLDSRLGIYRHDDLGVLKAADAPAILLEAAVIVHPDDDKRACSAEYQKRIAEAVREMATPLGK